MELKKYIYNKITDYYSLCFIKTCDWTGLTATKSQSCWTYFCLAGFFFRVILAARWCVRWTAFGSRQRCYHLKATPPVKHGKIQWWSWPNWATMSASWLRQWGRSYPPPPPPTPPATAPAHLTPPMEALLLTPPSSSSSISSSYSCVSASSHRNFIRIYMMSRAQMNVNNLDFERQYRHKAALTNSLLVTARNRVVKLAGLY